MADSYMHLAEPQAAISTLYLGSQLTAQFVKFLDALEATSFDGFEVSQPIESLSLSPGRLRQLCDERELTVCGFAMGSVTRRCEYAKEFPHAYLTLTAWIPDAVAQFASRTMNPIAIHPHLMMKSFSELQYQSLSKEISTQLDEKTRSRIKWIFDTAHHISFGRKGFVSAAEDGMLAAIHAKAMSRNPGTSYYSLSRAMCLPVDGDRAHLREFAEPIVIDTLRRRLSPWVVLEHNSVSSNWLKDLSAQDRWLNRLRMRAASDSEDGSLETDRQLDAEVRQVPPPPIKISTAIEPAIDTEVLFSKDVRTHYYRDVVKHVGETFLANYSFTLWSLDVSSEKLMLQEEWHSDQGNHARNTNIEDRQVRAMDCPGFLLSQNITEQCIEDSIGFKLGLSGGYRKGKAIQLPFSIFGDVSFRDHLLEIYFSEDELQHATECGELAATTISSLLSVALLEKRMLANNVAFNLVEEEVSLHKLSVGLCRAINRELGTLKCDLYLRDVAVSDRVRRVCSVINQTESPLIDTAVLPTVVLNAYSRGAVYTEIAIASEGGSEAAAQHNLAFPLLFRDGLENSPYEEDVDGLGPRRAIGVVMISSPHRKPSFGRFFSGIDRSVIQSLVAPCVHRFESLLEETRMTRQLRFLAHEVEQILPELTEKTSLLCDHSDAEVSGFGHASYINAQDIAVVVRNFRMYYRRDNRLIIERSIFRLHMLVHSYLEKVGECYRRTAAESYGGQCNISINYLSRAMESAGEHAKISGSEMQIKHILYNLFINGVSYAAKHDDRNLRVTISMTPKEVFFSFSSHTVMIPKDEHDRIFEPLYRSPSSKNLEAARPGLGLWASRRIANAHGGRLDIVRSNSKLTEFMLRLPLIRGWR